MKALVAAGLLLLAFAAAPAAGQVPRDPALTAEVTLNGDRWTVELRFPRAAPAWVLVRGGVTEQGARPWRPSRWTIETPGVRLERRGHYDALIGVDGRPVPARVRIRFVPPPERMRGEYDPALVFSDGAVALFSQQFDAFPTEDVDGIVRLQPGAELPYGVARVTFRDRAGPVLVGGRRVRSATLRSEEDGTYVLFGGRAPVATPALALIVDPNLPAWIAGAIREATPGILARYAAELGPAPVRPTIMVSWSGPTAGISSMGGGTLPGLIVMRFEGQGMLTGNAAARQSNIWFIAHEAAHFWLGQTVRYRSARDSWITEGGADLLAFRAVAAVDPTYDARRALNDSIWECDQLTRGRGVSSALERNENRAFYACGAIFALVAEAASHHPFPVFVRALIDGSRDDHEVTRVEWLAELTRVSNDPTLARDIAVLLDSGAADPKVMIISLLTRAGVHFTLGRDGLPRLS